MSHRCSHFGFWLYYWINQIQWSQIGLSCVTLITSHKSKTNQCDKWKASIKTMISPSSNSSLLHCWCVRLSGSIPSMVKPPCIDWDGEDKIISNPWRCFTKVDNKTERQHPSASTPYSSPYPLLHILQVSLTLLSSSHFWFILIISQGLSCGRAWVENYREIS